MKLTMEKLEDIILRSYEGKTRKTDRGERVELSLTGGSGYSRKVLTIHKESSKFNNSSECTYMAIMDGFYSYNGSRAVHLVLKADEFTFEVAKEAAIDLREKKEKSDYDEF